ncbi:MAG: DUF6282 family protein [Bryobacteraceae bacterium]
MNGLPDYLRGAADLHVHSAPDVVPRRFDDIELAREAARGGFGALLLKNHMVPTMDRAHLVRKIVPEIAVHGGIVLNDSVGGFNIAAVRVALELGAREVWMPTKSAHNHKLYDGEHGGLTVFDAHGELRQHVKEIVILMAHSNAILGTGHLSPAEGASLIRYAYAQGVRRMLVTHPEWAPTFYPIELQKDLAGYGVMFERCFVSTTALCGSVPMGTIVKAVSDVGIESTVLASDLGQPDTPAPVDGMTMYAEQMRAAGFAADDVRRMMVVNPLYLLE